MEALLRSSFIIAISAGEIGKCKSMEGKEMNGGGA
jgi:hypothetical protein